VSRHCLKWIYPAYLRYKPIELRTSSLHTFQNNHIDNNKTFFTRGVAVEDRQKGIGLIKAAIWTPFIAVAGLWRRHRAPLRFLPAPRNNSSALIYTHTHTRLIRIHTASCSKQHKWFTEPETTRCVDGQTQLSATPSDNLTHTHTHTINLLCKHCPAHITLCACAIRRALW